MASSWPVHGQFMASSWPVHGRSEVGIASLLKLGDMGVVNNIVIVIVVLLL